MCVQRFIFLAALCFPMAAHCLCEMDCSALCDEVVVESTTHFPGGPFVEASFIYWQPAFGDYPVAALFHEIGTTGDRESVDVQGLHFPFAPGFQLGVGYDLPCWALDLFVNWTWLRSNPHRTVVSDSQNIVLNLFQDAPKLFASEADSTGHIELNCCDVEFGKTFCAPCNGFIRLFAGLKAIWLNYDFNTAFLNPTNGSDLPYANLNNASKDQIWGIGPRIGFNTQWCLGTEQLTLLLNGAAALLWEKFSPTVSSTYTLNGDPHGGIEHAHIKEINPVVEFFVGLNYACYLNGAHAQATIGYEMQYWADQLHNTFINSNEPLTLQGLTVTLALSF